MIFDSQCFQQCKGRQKKQSRGMLVCLRGGRKSWKEFDGAVWHVCGGVRGLLLAVLLGAVHAMGAIDAHKPVEYRFAITNTSDEMQWVSGAGVSCGCVSADVAWGTEIAPGEVLAFTASLNPAGWEGPVAQAVWVELTPSGRTEIFPIEEMVRLRLGFKPSGAVFGSVRAGEMGRTLEARLSGYAAESAVPGEPHRIGDGGVFAVRLGEDGKSVVAGFARDDVPPGVYAETWAVPTGDGEIPELRFEVDARVEGVLSASPPVLDVASDDGEGKLPVLLRRSDGEAFTVLTAETGPERWGTTAVVPRPLNGWRIDVAEVDGDGLRSLSAEAFLQIETDCPSAESLRIPVRVGQGDRK